MKDLALLVADKNMDFAMRGILARPKALKIRAVDYEIRTHVNHDGGVRTTGPETLALLHKQFQHGILMLDLEGSGTEASTSLELEEQLDSRLAPLWGDRAKAIVIEPELDTWIWESDNVLSQIVGWSSTQTIRNWFRARGYLFNEHEKPARPKQALEELVRELNRPRSSVLYERITGKIILNSCIDPAFHRLRANLQAWFPEG